MKEEENFKKGSSDKDQLERKLNSLMAKVQQGDKTAYHLLLKELVVLSRHFVAGQITDAEEREDVVQEILIGVHRARHTYLLERPFLPWFYAIARYKIVDYIRKYQRRRKREEAVTRQLPENIVQSGDGLHPLSLENAKEAFNNLTPYQKKVFSLVKIEGFPVKEAAKRLNTSVSAVKVTVHRVYQKIKKALESE